MSRLFAFAAIVLAAPLEAGAQAPPGAPGYVGRWANEASWCRNRPGTTDELPMIFTERQVDGYEFRCRFDRVTPGVDSWRIAATCSGEGMVERRNFEFRLQGDRLLWIDPKRGTQPMYRCR